jgi:hypothetical protein
VKVNRERSNPAWSGRKAALGAAILCFVLALPAPALAITREEVVARASSWVNGRVGYSQRAFYGGYRRDCSGMVSMAWKLNTSYTSRTIASRARRISLSALKPGDAIVTPGHVQIYVGRASGRRIVVLEQSSSAHRAVRRVKAMPRRAVALRYSGITDAPVLVAAAIPPAPIAVAATLPAPTEPPASVAVAATVAAR